MLFEVAKRKFQSLDEDIKKKKYNRFTQFPQLTSYLWKKKKKV